MLEVTCARGGRREASCFERTARWQGRHTASRQARAPTMRRQQTTETAPFAAKANRVRALPVAREATSDSKQRDSCVLVAPTCCSAARRANGCTRTLLAARPQQRVSCHCQLEMPLSPDCSPRKACEDFQRWISHRGRKELRGLNVRRCLGQAQAFCHIERMCSYRDLGPSALHAGEHRAFSQRRTTTRHRWM